MEQLTFTLELLYYNGYQSTQRLGSRIAADRLIDRLVRRGRIRRWRIIEEN